MTPIRISIWRNREFEEENYLGEVEIGFSALLEEPGTWAVNKALELEAKQFEKEVSGSVGVQAKWTP